MDFCSQTGRGNREKNHAPTMTRTLAFYQLSKIYIEEVVSDCEKNEMTGDQKAPIGRINAHATRNDTHTNSLHLGDNAWGKKNCFVFKQISKSLQTLHVRSLFRFPFPILMPTSRAALKYCYQSSIQQ
jgi:hypothetical protein